jgi:hypothetical protein
MSKEKKELKKEKIYVAIKTISIIANKRFELIKNQEIDKEINPIFFDSLVNSNLIKLK